jgi:hypothetical protein
LAGKFGRQAGKRTKLAGIALDYAGKLKIVIRFMVWRGTFAYNLLNMEDLIAWSVLRLAFFVAFGVDGID